MKKTTEPQYQRGIDLMDQYGPTALGLMSNQVWHDDPRRLAFVLARYKFVSKMFAGMNSVLEVGCADAFASRIVRQEVKRLVVTDFDPVFVDDAKKHVREPWVLECVTHNMLDGPMVRHFDGAYALDVIEHIAQCDENRFLGNIVKSLSEHGVCILGAPSLESQAYASPGSREGHVNCKTGEELKCLMGRFFHNVFLFSMNDEVVHTGFYKMAHYLLAIGCFKR